MSAALYVGYAESMSAAQSRNPGQKHCPKHPLPTRIKETLLRSVAPPKPSIHHSNQIHVQHIVKKLLPLVAFPLMVFFVLGPPWVHALTPTVAIYVENPCCTFTVALRRPSVQERFYRIMKVHFLSDTRQQERLLL